MMVSKDAKAFAYVVGFPFREAVESPAEEWGISNNS